VQLGQAGGNPSGSASVSRASEKAERHFEVLASTVEVGTHEARLGQPLALLRGRDFGHGRP
jgi:hypothetical protein